MPVAERNFIEWLKIDEALITSQKNRDVKISPLHYQDEETDFSPWLSYSIDSQVAIQLSSMYSDSFSACTNERQRIFWNNTPVKYNKSFTRFKWTYRCQRFGSFLLNLVVSLLKMIFDDKLLNCRDVVENFHSQLQTIILQSIIAKTEPLLICLLPPAHCTLCYCSAQRVRMWWKRWEGMLAQPQNYS